MDSWIRIFSVLEKVSGLKAFFNHSIKGILKGVVSLLVLFSGAQVAAEIDFRTLCGINLSNQVVDVKENGLVGKVLENGKPHVSIVEPVIRQAENVDPQLKEKFSEFDGSVFKKAVSQLFVNQGIDPLKYFDSDNLYLDEFCFQNATRYLLSPSLKSIYPGSCK